MYFIKLSNFYLMSVAWKGFNLDLSTSMISERSAFICDYAITPPALSIKKKVHSYLIKTCPCGEYW